MADLTSGRVEALLAKAQALVDAITFDENGAMIAGEWRGGNGGMVSRPTIVAADALRTELLAWKAGRDAYGARLPKLDETGQKQAAPAPPLVGPADQ